tara:strand:- start:712 stop:1017 length:306 start_codon:yes stop_codon:yes gene_type:complete
MSGNGNGNGNGNGQQTGFINSDGILSRFFLEGDPSKGEIIIRDFPKDIRKAEITLWEAVRATAFLPSYLFREVLSMWVETVAVRLQIDDMKRDPDNIIEVD